MSESGSKATRRSTRLSVSIPIVISGKDAAGNDFTEHTRTRDVNKHGAKIMTARQLAMGTEVSIENRALGVVAGAKVVWLGKNQSPDDLRQVGLQLMEAPNIWGIEFPPDDWSASVKDGDAQISMVTPGTATGSSSEGGAESPAAPRVGEDDARQTAAEDLADRLLERLQESADVQTQKFQERLEQLALRIAQQLETDMHERAASVKTQEAGAWEEQLQLLGKRLDAARDQTEKLEGKVQELQHLTHPATEGEAMTLAQVQEARRELMALSNSVIESMNQAAEAGLKEYRSRLEKALREFVARLKHSGESLTR